MSTRRIVLNASATYIRTVVAVGLALVSGRWVIGALGHSDYGLYAVVGSTIVFITFVNSVMATSAARHFAFAVGQGDSGELTKWFNSALNIHLILPLLLVLLGWPIGEYCIKHFLTIPPERVVACVWVFRLSLLLALVSMMATPYLAMFSAKQHIAELAAWGTLQTVVTFAFAYLLTKVSGDRLLFCAGYGVAVGVVFQAIQVVRAHFLFQECRCDLGAWFNRERCSKLFSFGLWIQIGMFSGMLRMQGLAILINLSFNATVNAAYGVASTVASQTTALSGALMGALAPEITATEGRGDRARMLDLALRSCKFGTLSMLLLAVPLGVEMPYVLKLWLGQPPEYASQFCQLMLLGFVIEVATIGHMLALSAQGQIAAYQATVGGLNLLTVPLAWGFIKAGLAPPCVGVAAVISYAACSLMRVLWARHLLQMSAASWLKSVVLVCGIVCLGALLASGLVLWSMPPSFARFVVSSAASTAVIGLLAWTVALDLPERLLMQRILGTKGRLMFKRSRAAWNSGCRHTKG